MTVIQNISDRARQVDTVASLSSTAKQNGDLFTTKGRNSTGDSGSNTYIYRSSGKSGITIDGGFYIAGPGSDDYFEAIDRSVAYVKHFGADESGLSATDTTTRIQAAIDAAKAAGTSLGTIRIEFTPGVTYQINSLTLDTIKRAYVTAMGANFQLNTTTPGFTVSSAHCIWDGGTFYNISGTNLAHALEFRSLTAAETTASIHNVKARDIYRFISCYMDVGAGKTAYRFRFFNCNSRNTVAAMQVAGGYGIHLGGDSVNNSAGNDTDVVSCDLVGHNVNLYTNGVHTKVFGGTIDGGIAAGVELDGANLFESSGVYFEFNAFHYKYTNSPLNPSSSLCSYSVGGTTAFSTGSLAAGNYHFSYGDSNQWTGQDKLQPVRIDNNSSTATLSGVAIHSRGAADAIRFHDVDTLVGRVTKAGHLSIGTKLTAHHGLVHGIFRAAAANQGNVVLEVGRDSIIDAPVDLSATFHAVNDGVLPATINCALTVYRDTVTGASIVTSGKIYAPSFDLLEVGADPANPTEGRSVIWMSNGVGTGDDGDVLLKTTAGGVTTIHNITTIAYIAEDLQSTQTTVTLESITDPINTIRKYVGKMIWNTTTGKPVWASGSTAGAVWVDATGATAHTPV